MTGEVSGIGMISWRRDLDNPSSGPEQKSQGGFTIEKKRWFTPEAVELEPNGPIEVPGIHTASGIYGFGEELVFTAFLLVPDGQDKISGSVP
jgi:hypothetical protein